MYRMYISLIIPLFFGPYWSYVGSQTSFAFSFFLSAFIQLALCGLLNVALDLEDPFDNHGMDGIFIDEQLFEVAQVLPAECNSFSRSPSVATCTKKDDEQMTPCGNGMGTPMSTPFATVSTEPAPRVVRIETDVV